MSTNALPNETQQETTTFAIDSAHSVAEFSVKHLMISTVTGRFQTVRGTLYLDEKDPSKSRVEAEIDAATVETGVPDRDGHLKSADFFDVERHPVLAFKSTRVEPKGDDEARVVGDLTIRGITKEVALDVEFDGEIKDPWGNRRLGFTATTTINRKDWNLNWNQVLEAGGVMVSDKVKLSLHVAAVAQDDGASVEEATGAEA